MVRFREGGVACVWVSFRGGMVSFSGGGVASACISYRQGGVACVCVGFRGAGMVSFRESVINAKNMILPNMIKDWDLYLRTTGIGLRKKKEGLSTGAALNHFNIQLLFFFVSFFTYSRTMHIGLKCKHL